MSIVKMVENNPKTATILLGGLTVLNVISLGVSGIYVRTVKKDMKSLEKKIVGISDILEEMIEEDEDSDTESEDSEK